MQQCSRVLCHSVGILILADAGRRFQLRSDDPYVPKLLIHIVQIFKVFNYNTYCAECFCVLSFSMSQDSANR